MRVFAVGCLQSSSISAKILVCALLVLKLGLVFRSPKRKVVNYQAYMLIYKPDCTKMSEQDG
jgi:hypothetical protein